MLNLSQARTVAEAHIGWHCSRGWCTTKGLDAVRALAELAQQWDGVDYAINSALDVRRQLQTAADSHGCQDSRMAASKNPPRTQPISASDDLGEPAWMVYADLHGNPRSHQPIERTVYPPSSTQMATARPTLTLWVAQSTVRATS